MESIRYSMNYENCSLKCQLKSPKPLDDEHSIKVFRPNQTVLFVHHIVCQLPDPNLDAFVGTLYNILPSLWLQQLRKDQNMYETRSPRSTIKGDLYSL